MNITELAFTVDSNYHHRPTVKYWIYCTVEESLGIPKNSLSRVSRMELSHPGAGTSQVRTGRQAVAELSPIVSKVWTGVEYMQCYMDGYIYEGITARVVIVDDLVKDLGFLVHDPTSSLAELVEHFYHNLGEFALNISFRPLVE